MGGVKCAWCGAGRSAAEPIIVEPRSAKRNDNQEQQLFAGRRRGGWPRPASYLRRSVIPTGRRTDGVARGVESAVDMFYTARARAI